MKSTKKYVALILTLLMVFGIGVYIGVYLLERKISGDLTAKKKGPAGNRPEAAAARMNNMTRRPRILPSRGGPEI